MTTYVNPPAVPLPSGGNSTWASIASGCAAGSVGVTLLFLSKPSINSSILFGIRHPLSTDSQTPLTLPLSTTNPAAIVAHTGVDSTGHFAMWIATVITTNAANYGIYLLKDYPAGSAVFLQNAVQIFTGWPTTATEYPQLSNATTAGAANATGCFLECSPAFQPRIFAHGSTDAFVNGGAFAPANGCQSWIVGFNPTDTNKNIKCQCTAGGGSATSVLYLKGFIQAGLNWNVTSVDRTASMTAANTLTPLPLQTNGTEYLYQMSGGAGAPLMAVMSTGISAALASALVLGNSAQLFTAAPPEAITASISGAGFSVRELGYFVPLATPPPTWNRGRVNIMTTTQGALP